MKKIFLILFLSLIVHAQNVQVNKLRTDLYSKKGANTLKKVELSLEFEGQKLQENTSKLIDAVNTVISGFFYEDIFTELGKNNFKKTLERFIEKKYKIKIDNIFILTLSGVEQFDIEEFKRFLESVENGTKEGEIQRALNNFTISKNEEPQDELDSIKEHTFFEEDRDNLPQLPW